MGLSERLHELAAIPFPDPVRWFDVHAVWTDASHACIHASRICIVMDDASDLVIASCEFFDRQGVMIGSPKTPSSGAGRLVVTFVYGNTLDLSVHSKQPRAPRTGSIPTLPDLRRRSRPLSRRSLSPKKLGALTPLLTPTEWFVDGKPHTQMKGWQPYESFALHRDASVSDISATAFIIDLLDGRYLCLSSHRYGMRRGVRVQQGILDEDGPGDLCVRPAGSSAFFAVS